MALQTPTEFDELHAMFSNLRIDVVATGSVRNVTLIREAAELELA